MRDKSEDALAELKLDYEDDENKIRLLTGAKRKQVEEIVRLKFQLEVMTRQISMIPPATSIGFR